MAQRHGWRRVARAGAAICALLLAAPPPARAATSIRTVDGSMLEVWEGGIPTPGAQTSAGSGLFYTLTDLVGTTSGSVVPAASGTSDNSPMLALEAANNTPVVVWSRSDGVSQKIAYARFQSAAWQDVHFVTFGTRNDTEPRIGRANNGAFLFWISDTFSYMYAPINLTAGVLNAAPREILPRVRVDTTSSSTRTTTTTTGLQPISREGGTDVPTVLGNCDPLLSRQCGGQSGATGPPLQPRRLEGGTDVPVVVGATTSVWWVASNTLCATQILVRPSRDFLRMEVISFNNGRVVMLNQYEMPSALPDGYAADTANSYLQLYCQ